MKKVERFRISEKMDFKARAYDREGTLLAVINDSGYHSIQMILDELSRRTFYGKTIAEFSISIEDSGSYARYKVVGGGFRRLY